jgi:hypothetical protein
MSDYYGQFLIHVDIPKIQLAYEAAKSTGYNLSNHDLKNKIMRYYEIDHRRVLDLEEDLWWNFQEHMIPFVKEYFDSFLIATRANPRNLNDPQLREDTYTLIAILESLIRECRKACAEYIIINQRLIESIDQELEGDQ